MKTTLEIPDAIFRQAKARAAEQGIPLRQFITDAVADKLRQKRGGEEKPWLELAGNLRHLHKETSRINKLMEREFETIEPGEWS